MRYIFLDEKLGIRKMEDNIMDYSHMVKWLSTPEVLEYYEGRNNAFDLDKVMKKFAPRAKGQEAFKACIIEYDQKAIGYLQYYPLDDEYGLNGTIDLKDYKLPYGIDLFIGELDMWNQGIGTTVVRALVKYLFHTIRADIVFIDPQTWNKRAIRCYEKSGFTRRIVIEGREMHEGGFKDSLIMSVSIDEWESECDQL
ncbi:GNAT family N-acetyltransferase [Clostridium sp. Marseille-P299]|uniref:GNAT family N-acetyltransferase n=1 Tax=Clostridium sp. Marseille-P299 TaxID=1805477 RepID=UPI0008326948|nr:GNAT family N-acetyltransferase [Clostridium sp. Marseille-P299]